MDNFSITKFFRNQYLTEGDVSIRPFDLEKHQDIKVLTDELSNALGVDIEQSLGSGNYSGRSGYYMNMPREMQNWDDQSSTKVEYVFDNINKLSKEYEFEFKDVSDSETEPGERIYPATVEFFLKEKNIDEMDMNDPVLMKMRAAKMKDDQPKKSINPNFQTTINTKKLAFLKKERDQLMRDMEQEAEPEGGPIADEYGNKLNRIDKAIAKLSGRKEMTYDQSIAETIKLGEGVIEEDLCAKGKAYRKKRMAAGEKSSAYLNGRAVKVCKGQMKG